MQPKTVAVCPVVALRPGGPCAMATLFDGRAVISWRARCRHRTKGEKQGFPSQQRGLVDLVLRQRARQAHTFGGDGQHSLANVADGEQDVSLAPVAHREIPTGATSLMEAPIEAAVQPVRFVPYPSL